MIFADSHAHLDYPDFENDYIATLTRARFAGVRYIQLIATKLSEVNKICAFCQQDSDLRAAVGIHPHYAAEAPDSSVEAIIGASSQEGVVAIGETGLDFHYEYSPREIQERVFRHHIRAAFWTGLPLIVHTREAEKETRRILTEEAVGAYQGVFHCYTGSKELALWGVGQGFYISFSGIITFRTADSLRQLACELPLERILLETDSPYLAPIPHRGRRNEPAFVVEVAKVLAEVRGISLAQVAQATTENYLRLFRPAHQEILAYRIGRGLYLNVTRGCTLKCAFCPKWSHPRVHSYDLTLHRNPSAEELIAAMGDISPYEEIVFCGFGEPTLRLEVILKVAQEVKRRGGKRVRLNTDGLANRLYQTDITPRFSGLLDAISISLNAQDQSTYDRHCHPGLSGSYAAVKEFIKKVKSHVPEVTVTVVQGLEGVDVEACRHLAEEELGVHFRVRTLGRVG
ncbi:MAG: YchF/TatD family DNA exonuclease [Magnetococcus sp. DMHC-6]